MADEVFFKPKPGVLVPKNPRWDPNQYFPPEGAWCARDHFMERRVREGAGEFIDPNARPSAAEGSPIATEEQPQWQSHSTKSLPEN